MANDIVLYEIKDKVAHVTINRPDSLNALNTSVYRALGACMDEIKNNGAIRVVIIKGAGNRAFIAGADIKEMLELDVLGGEKFAEVGIAVHKKIRSLENQIVIAAINGFALGGGLELAMTCDIRIATPKSKLGLPETGLGVVPGNTGTQRLPRLVGSAAAIEMISTGVPIDAQRAEKLGLVNAVVSEEQLLTYCEELAQKIVQNSPAAIAACKHLIYQGLDMGIEQGIAMETLTFAKCFATVDQKEGMCAFVEKRRAKF